jgi:hypothetical protein
MNDRLMQRFTSLVREPGNEGSPEEPVLETEGVDDLGTFGWLRGMRERSVMLELRQRNGNALAIDYGGLEIEFDPSEGIVLHTMSGRKVIIKGRNLNAAVRPTITLFGGLTRHRVPWVRESANSGAFQSDKSATVIEVIQW